MKKALTIMLVALIALSSVFAQVLMKLQLNKVLYTG